MTATSSTTAGLPSPSAPSTSYEEQMSSLSALLICLLLIVSLLTSYYLQLKRIRAIHETLVSIGAGMVVGLIVRLVDSGDAGAGGTVTGPGIREMLTFRHTVFFNVLLPPIILNSGYEIKQNNFFRNFTTILTFALLGTFISAVGIGLLTFLYSFLSTPFEGLNLSLIECLIFGSTLSATDPVTILSIFNTYRVDPKLYTIIFGESLLNDAVSIVMYETLHRFHVVEPGQHQTAFTMSSGLTAVGMFLLSFTGSMALGVVFGLVMSLILKHSQLHQFPSIESCLVLLSAYTCYFFANSIGQGSGLSGIVSLLFCGITLKHYAYHTMSRRTKRSSRYIFGVLAHLTENFIFIYLGMSLFTGPPSGTKVISYFRPMFILVTFFSVIVMRYIAVFPLSRLINLYHKHVLGQQREELPHSYQMMLFWAGLRGAVGVALAAGFAGANREMLRETVLVVVLATVLLFGGTTSRVMEIVGIRTGVKDTEDDERSSDEDEVREGPMRIGHHYNHHGHLSPGHRAAISAGVFSSYSSEDDSDGEVLPLHPQSRPQPPRQGPEQNQNPVVGGEDGKWFQALDERYLLPLFSNATASRTFHARRAARRNQSSVSLNHGSPLPSPGDSDDEWEGPREPEPLSGSRDSVSEGRRPASRSGSRRASPSPPRR